MKLTDARVTIFGQQFGQHGRHGVVFKPGANLTAAAIRPQHGDDQIGGDGVQLLCALIARTRHERTLQASVTQYCDRLRRWQLLPGIVAVMDVCVVQSKVCLRVARRRETKQQQALQCRRSNTCHVAKSSRHIASLIFTRIIRLVLD